MGYCVGGTRRDSEILVFLAVRAKIKYCGTLREFEYYAASFESAIMRNLRDTKFSLREPIFVLSF
jgi:hypothetical protein